MPLNNSYAIGAALAAIFLASSATATAQETASVLPGGATSIQETYQDWRLACQGTPQKLCVVSQQQVHQNGQRVIAIELRRNGDTLSGNLFLPFGLMLDAGAALQIDDAAQPDKRAFSTCLPVGCLVPLEFRAEEITALRTGTTLKVRVRSVEPDDATFSVSLKGLGTAVDRLDVLANM